MCDKNSPLKRRSVVVVFRVFSSSFFLLFFFFFFFFFVFFLRGLSPVPKEMCSMTFLFLFVSRFLRCSLHTVCYLSIQRIKDAQIIILDVHETWVCGSLFLPTNGYHFSCLNKAWWIRPKSRNGWTFYVFFNLVLTYSTANINFTYIAVLVFFILFIF